MSKVLAVALLDVRRLGFGIASAALVAGLIPTLASGLGGTAPPELFLTFVFALAGLAAGGTFGNDFAEGRSSFFFARPLSTGALIAGRFAALLGLSAAALLSFMVSHWLSGRGREGFTLWILSRSHAEVLANCWVVSLFFALAASARGRRTTSAGGLRSAVMIPVRLFVSFGAFTLVFGLFADLVLRAYFKDATPIRLFLESWVAAGFVASLVAIGVGRTEAPRISEVLGKVMLAHFVLVTLTVIGSWTWVLHPGPQAIESIERMTWGSPDGRTAYVRTSVGRGDGQTFRPVFILDIASGQARRLNADPFQGPWTSADGDTLVWSEATPFFFRPLWRSAGGATTFRVRDSSGEVTVLPMPNDLPDFTKARDLSNFAGVVNRVLPSREGDVFAILWDRHLTFTSRGHGQLSDVNLGADRPSVRSMAFLPSGELRAAIARRAPSGPNFEIVDIEPKSGTPRIIASTRIESPGWMRFDATASRALVMSSAPGNRGVSIALLVLAAGREPESTALVEAAFSPNAIFLADGRIAVSSGGSVGAWEKRTLRVLSATGQTVLDIPMADGVPVGLGNEMFPGVLSVRTSYANEISLIDATSGALIRKIPGLSVVSSFWPLDPPPPGTPAARLLESRDGKLYELPSLDAEPRLLLPLPKP